MSAGRTPHKQVSVQSGEWSADVDVELAPLISEIWQAGLYTVLSCQEHATTGKVWIAFIDARTAEAFLNAVAVHDGSKGSLWRRMDDWYFGEFGEHSEHIGRHQTGEADWEYHVAITDDAYNESVKRWRKKGTPNFRLAVSVLFPRSDLATVTERMATFNKSRSEEHGTD